MIDYNISEENNQIVLRINNMQSDFDFWQSPDEWLTVIHCGGGASGWLGTGGCNLTIDPKYLPMEVKSPHYEYEEDRKHTFAQLTKNLETFNGNVLS